MNIQGQSLSINSLFKTNQNSKTALNPYQKSAQKNNAVAQMVQQRMDSVEISSESKVKHETLVRSLQSEKVNSTSKNSNAEEQIQAHLDFTHSQLKEMDKVIKQGLEQVSILEDPNSPDYEKNNARKVLEGVREITDFSSQLVGTGMVRQAHPEGMAAFDKVVSEVSKDSKMSQNLQDINSFYQSNTNSTDSGFLKVSVKDMNLENLENLSVEDMKERLTNAHEYLSKQEEVMGAVSVKFKEMVSTGEIDLEDSISQSQQVQQRDSLSNSYSRMQQLSNLGNMIDMMA